MGLKRRSRFAFAACLLGANAPDIDVFAPLVLPVDGIAFHRGPVHSVFAWPVLAAAIVAILWIVDRFKSRRPDASSFRPGALFLVTFLAVLTHPFLDLAHDLRHCDPRAVQTGGGIRATRSSSSTGFTGC